MDIRVAVTSAGIFFAIYALTLGVPLYLFFLGHHLAALVLAIVLATVAPFIYSHFRKRAEDKILIQEKTYQDILLRAARGLNRHKTVEEVARFMVHLLSKVIATRNAAFYVREEHSFVLSDSMGAGGDYARVISDEAPVSRYLKRSGTLALDEMRDGRFSGAAISRDVVETLRLYSAVVAVPILRDEKVNGIFFLGEKSNDTPYSERDISVLNIIADQTALAIENCRYLKAERERIKEEGAKVRREYLDTMVACMAHEIDNPMTVIIGQAGLLKEILSFSSAEISEHIHKEINGSLGYMHEAALRVSKIIKKVEEFAKGGAGKSEPTNIYDVIDGYRVIKELSKKKKTDVLYEEHIEENLPYVHAEKIMLEEILINFMENAYHAVAHNEGSRAVVLRIFQIEEFFVRVMFEDNGYGMTHETLQKVFEVPTTTKGSTEGTGLGLYRVRQICDVLGARFGAHSDGPQKGARIWVDLRVL